MNKLSTLLPAAVVLLMSTGLAFAQTPAAVTVVSGNGQLICFSCGPNFPAGYSPLVVKVTDAAGAPLAGVTVDWSVVSGIGGGGFGFNSDFTTALSTQTSTDNAGIATTPFYASIAQFGGQEFLQSQIVARAGNASTNFYLTQGVQGQAQSFGAVVGAPITISIRDDGRNRYDLVTGQAGTRLDPPFRIQITTSTMNTPIPNVALFLVNDQAPAEGPIASCAATGAAGAGIVLSDATGVASCSPILGGAPNVLGRGGIVVGGVIPADGTAATGFRAYDFQMRSTPAAAGQITAISGNQQSAQAGQALAQPLVVEVRATGGSTLSGITVNWSVTPANSATLGAASTVTDSSGRTNNTLRFNTATTGPVTVTATIAGDTTKTVSFTATAIPLVTITGLQVVSGSTQSAIVNTAFGAPLIVQVNSSAGPAAGVPVSFSVSGPATLSAATATTGANGQAQVNVQAGATTGTVTVTATASGFSQTFTLTVVPPGPNLQTATFANAADLQRGALSPCSLATIVATNIAPGLQGMVTAGPVGLLPGTLNNTRVSVGGISAPISSVGRNAGGQETLTFQVPCDVNPGSSVPVVVNVGAGSATINIPIQQVSPGIFTQFGSDNVNRAVVIRPEGSYVSASNPARRGENLTALVTGLGASIPVVGTNSVAAPGSITAPQGTVIVGMAGRGLPLISTQLSPDLVGVWLVQFTIPSDMPVGNQTFSISVIPSGSSSPVSSGTAIIPVQ